MKPVLATGLLCTMLAGCYTYTVSRGAAPEVGTHVQIHLYKEVTDSLGLELGPGVAYVEGVVVRDDSTGLQLAVSRVEGRQEVPSTWSGERFTFPHGSYSSLEERRINVAGSVLLGGLATGAVLGLHKAFESSGVNSLQTGTRGAPAQ